MAKKPKESIDEFIKHNEFDGEEKSESIVALSTKGVIRAKIIERMTRGESPFPVKNFITQETAKAYFLHRTRRHEKKKRAGDEKNPLLIFVKSVHRKEVMRIQKAFLTIGRNVENELIVKDGVDIAKVNKFIQLMWIQDEFYISKEVIRKHLNSLSVFYKSCGTRESKNK